LPRLKCTFREFIAILEAHGFSEVRHQSGSHRRFRGKIGGQIRMVTVAYHNIGDEVLTGTLESMIRQSGLTKKLFRK
jgi:predicted RNA binding protein YcfA (HicA-like mRNA interferase family)